VGFVLFYASFESNNVTAYFLCHGGLQTCHDS
jgi:hypothetical protein